MSDIASKIEQLTEEYAYKIAALMREHVQTVFFSPESARPAAPRKRAPRALPAPGRALVKKAAPSKGGRTYPPHCLAPGCEEAHGGPRNSFMCKEHSEALSKEQKKQFSAAWKATQKS